MIDEILFEMLTKEQQEKIQTKIYNKILEEVDKFDISHAITVVEERVGELIYEDLDIGDLGDMISQRVMRIVKEKLEGLN